MQAQQLYWQKQGLLHAVHLQEDDNDAAASRADQCLIVGWLAAHMFLCCVTAVHASLATHCCCASTLRVDCALHAVRIASANLQCNGSSRLVEICYSLSLRNVRSAVQIACMCWHRPTYSHWLGLLPIICCDARKQQLM
jgi:hypothetical protein